MLWARVTLNHPTFTSTPSDLYPHAAPSPQCGRVVGLIGDEGLGQGVFEQDIRSFEIMVSGREVMRGRVSDPFQPLRATHIPNAPALPEMVAGPRNHRGVRQDNLQNNST